MEGRKERVPNRRLTPRCFWESFHSRTPFAPRRLQSGVAQKYCCSAEPIFPCIMTLTTPAQECDASVALRDRRRPWVESTRRCRVFRAAVRLALPRAEHGAAHKRPSPQHSVSCGALAVLSVCGWAVETASGNGVWKRRPHSGFCRRRCCRAPACASLSTPRPIEATLTRHTRRRVSLPLVFLVFRHLNGHPRNGSCPTGAWTNPPCWVPEDMPSR